MRKSLTHAARRNSRRRSYLLLVLALILLTLAAIRATGLPCAGIFLNQLDDQPDTAMITNVRVVRDLAGVPLLEHLSYQQDLRDEKMVRTLTC